MMMRKEKARGPAGGSLALVSSVVGTTDRPEFTTPRTLQASQLRKRFNVSEALAYTIAELAFSNGGRA